MSSTTTNLGLHKIDLTDAPPDITVLNQNWETIDTELFNTVNKVAVYYSADTNKSADNLTDPFALIPLSSTVNGELYSILGGSFAYVRTMFYDSASTTSRRLQLAFSYNSGYSHMAMRVYSSNGWVAWKKVADTDDLNSLVPDLSGVVSKSGDTMTGQLRIKNNESATNGMRIGEASTTGAVLIDQSDIEDDTSDRSGLKIMNSSDTLGEMAQLFRTVNGTTTWYPLYGKHNAFLGCKLYSSLSDIGLTVGSETIDDIATNLPNNSILVIGITTSNATVYPSNYGLLTVKRSSATRIEFDFVTTAGVSYHAFYSITSNGDTWTGWHENARLSDGVLAVSKGGTGVTSLSELATAMGAAQITVGSYSGGGKSGSNTPKTLKFGFLPKIVFIISGISTATLRPASTSYKEAAGNSVAESYGYSESMYVKYSGTTVYWYNNKGANYQMDTSGQTYYYVAIG